MSAGLESEHRAARSDERSELSVCWKFDSQATRTPDAVAVVDGERQLTYATLERLASGCAALLRRHEVAPETIVGICGIRSPELIGALLGVLHAGAAYLPLDRGYPTERVRYMISRARVRLAIVVGDVDVSWLGEIPNVIRVDAGTMLSHADTGLRRRYSSGDTLAAILFTSGSLGLPKAVALPHGALTARASYGLQRYGNDVIPQKASMSVVGHLGDLLTPLLSGRPVLIVSDNAVRNPVEFARVLREHGVTRVMLVPSQLQSILESAAAVDLLQGLRVLIVGGEGISPLLASLVRDRLPGVSLLNAYGVTETSGGASVGTIVDNRPIVIDTPVEGARLYVCDKNLEPVRSSGTGEICVSSPQLARGYLGEAALTADRFVPDPLASWGERIYRTGDVARVHADGAIEIVGRADHEVKVRGFRVNLREVETALERCPGVRRAAAILRTDVMVPALVAFVEPTTPGRLSAEQLRASVSEWLPAPMVPAKIHSIDELPSLPTGKLDRRALTALVAVGEPSADAAPVHPRTEIEAGLFEIWSEVLSPGTFGIHDEFLSLGGNSLHMMQIAARVVERWRVNVSTETFLEHPTIGKLATLLAPRIGES